MVRDGGPTLNGRRYIRFTMRILSQRKDRHARYNDVINWLF